MQFYRNSGEEIKNFAEIDWSFNAWQPHEAQWHEGNDHSHEHDAMEHHVDLGCGRIKKARIGVDRHFAPGVNVVMDLDDKNVRLPFPDSYIDSYISHHFFEHVGEGFIPLIDEIYRTLRPGGILRAITPLFPSTAAVQDPDHCRYFMAESENHCTWDTFCGVEEAPHWHDSFSVPYTGSRFEKIHQTSTPRLPNSHDWWGAKDHRELRVTLRKR